MGAEQKAEELGISFPTKEKGYLNLCVRSGNLLITSGHVSDLKGKLGAGLSVEQDYQVARDCAVKILVGSPGPRDARRPARAEAPGVRQLGAGLHRPAPGHQRRLRPTPPALRQGRP